MKREREREYSEKKNEFSVTGNFSFLQLTNIFFFLSKGTKFLFQSKDYISQTPSLLRMSVWPVKPRRKDMKV